MNHKYSVSDLCPSLMREKTQDSGKNTLLLSKLCKIGAWDIYVSNLY